LAGRFILCYLHIHSGLSGLSGLSEKSLDDFTSRDFWR